jgi:transposase-like protein
VHQWVRHAAVGFRSEPWGSTRLIYAFDGISVFAVGRTAAELVAERGVEVDAGCIWRWVQVYAPELNKRCRPRLKPTHKSYRIDETHIKVKGEDKYLYRALDSTSQTIHFLLTANAIQLPPNALCARRLRHQAIRCSG